MKYRKLYKFNSGGGKENIMSEYRRFKEAGIPSKVLKLKNPIGLRTHGLYYRPLDLRTTYRPIPINVRTRR